MNKEEFIEQVYEIAFGDDAVNKKYSDEEVIARIREFSDSSLKYEQGFNIMMDYFDDICEDEREEVSKQLEEIGL